MKKRLIVPAALTALALMGIAPAATASTAAAGSAKTTAASSAEAKACKEPIKAPNNVKIHKKPSHNSTSLRLMYKNTKGCWIDGVSGGKTSKCGAPDDWDGWGYISYRGTKGYVPNMCVIPA
ncbi:hypothetical protein ACTWQF_31815 [Streptomyces sp. 8N114]|uniref:hypothetical protein n=1 Tax=Streptomyces sp. 8N114 TaxID=3457419 RepID=UPI003FD4E09E